MNEWKPHHSEKYERNRKLLECVRAGATLEQVSQRFGITRSRVYQTCCKMWPRAYGEFYSDWRNKCL